MVEFDATDDANAELLNKLKHLDVRVETVETNKGICKKSFWKSLKLRSALNHIGLLVGLSVYCGVGGIVSYCFNYLSFSFKFNIHNFIYYPIEQKKQEKYKQS